MKYLPHRRPENTMLIDVHYHRPSRETDWKDSLDIIYKDTDTQEKFIETIKCPEVEIYFTKEEFQNYNFNKSFLPLEEAEVHTVPYKDLEFYIAKQAGPEYLSHIKGLAKTNRGAMKNIHKYRNVFGSDYDIENMVRIQWLLHNDSDTPKPITKQYLDIEVDSIDIAGFPKPGEVPINACTIIDQNTMQSFTFLLRNVKNPLIQEFEDNISEFIEELHEDFDETYGKLKYNFYMYDEDKEIDLIIDMFKLINTLKADFLLIWNAGFDIPYIIQRIRELGMDERDIMCHPDFPIKEARYRKDNRNFSVQNKSDYFTVSSYTVFLDQMLLYAGLRKGQGEQRSYALNTIGQKEVGDEKLDYSEEADIKTLPYVNYQKFVKYNIKDVLLQMGIENRTGDVDNIYSRAYTNVTAYKKIFKQTVFLKNRGYVDYFKQGFIIGNNINIEHGVYDDNSNGKNGKDDDDEKFDGALVADPELNEAMGIKVFGVPSKYIFDFVVDMDFSSMYPNEIIAFNIAPNTMIGKLALVNDAVEAYKSAQEEITKEDKVEDAGKDFVDNMLTKNVLNMGTKWFNLPRTEEVQALVDEEFNSNSVIRIQMDNSYLEKREKNLIID